MVKKKFFSRYAPRPWGMQPNASLWRFQHAYAWADFHSCLYTTYYTISGMSAAFSSHHRGNSAADDPATNLSTQFTPTHTAYPPSRLSSLTNFVHHLGKCTDTLINHQCTLGQTSLIFTPTITVAFAAHHLLLCRAPFHLLVRTKTSSGAQHHQQSIKGQTPLTQ